MGSVGDPGPGFSPVDLHRDVKFKEAPLEGSKVKFYFILSSIDQIKML